MFPKKRKSIKLRTCLCMYIYPYSTFELKSFAVCKKKQENLKLSQMANHQIFQNFKPSFTLQDIDTDMEFINNFSGLCQNYEDSSAFNFHNSINNFLPHLSSINHGSFENGALMQPLVSNEDEDRKEKKRKATTDLSTPERSTCSYSSPQGSDSGSRKAKRGGRGKKGAEKEEEKHREVIHVRAKRGQATDSHSLAERVRRGKINERLQCLQDIVPGCYKTMGMAVMLDEIINYVQSLQNQVDFLSMKLAAASTFHDFNADIDTMEEMQRANAFEAMKRENLANHSTQLLSHNFGTFPHFSHTK